MRANVHDYDLVVPGTLLEALDVLAAQHHVPIAGGTEIMVALAAGKLPRKPLMSISHLKDLRFIKASTDGITIGSGTTFTDLRRSALIGEQLPMLNQAASWTGSIANQNRGTLGGNVVNASPAADSAPALLVYEADVIVISKAGQRQIPYRDFHLGYKQTALAANELVHSFRVAPISNVTLQSSRKVGARNAQAISKVALAALGFMQDGVIHDIRLAAASVREVPCRFVTAENALLGRSLTPETIAAARKAVIEEARPIDDIRSTAIYRSTVTANLVEDFLRSLQNTAASRH